MKVLISGYYGFYNIGNEEKIEYDYEYLLNKSFLMDLYIIIMTALKVLKRSDIKD